MNDKWWNMGVPGIYPWESCLVQRGQRRIGSMGRNWRFIGSDDWLTRVWNATRAGPSSDIHSSGEWREMRCMCGVEFNQRVYIPLFPSLTPDGCIVSYLFLFLSLLSFSFSFPSIFIFASSTLSLASESVEAQASRWATWALCAVADEIRNHGRPSWSGQTYSPALSTSSSFIVSHFLFSCIMIVLIRSSSSSWFARNCQALTLRRCLWRQQGKLSPPYGSWRLVQGRRDAGSF